MIFRKKSEQKLQRSLLCISFSTFLCIGGLDIHPKSNEALNYLGLSLLTTDKALAGKKPGEAKKSDKQKYHQELKKKGNPSYDPAIVNQADKIDITNEKYQKQRNQGKNRKKGRFRVITPETIRVITPSLVSPHQAPIQLPLNIRRELRNSDVRLPSSLRFLRHLDLNGPTFNRPVKLNGPTFNRPSKPVPVLPKIPAHLFLK